MFELVFMPTSVLYRSYCFTNDHAKNQVLNHPTIAAKTDYSNCFSFVEWTHEVMSSVTEDVLQHFQLLGAIEALAAIFKVCF
jgi:hypothetical protein